MNREPYQPRPHPSDVPDRDVDSKYQEPPNPDDEPGVRHRRTWLYGLVAGVAATLGAGLSWRVVNPDSGVPMVKDGADLYNSAEVKAALKDFWGREFRTPDGAFMDMARYRSRPLLINFWATWCPPCVEELPLLNRFFEQNRHNGWQVLGLAVDQPEPVKAFLIKSPLSFPVALAGADGISLTKALGNSSGGLPFSVLIHANGQVIKRKIGQLHEDELGAWVRADGNRHQD